MKLKKHILLLFTIFIQFLVYGQNSSETIGHKANVVSKTLSIPKRISYTSDFEQLFTEIEIKKLDSIIIDFQNRTSNQIAIVTLNQLQLEEENFNDYTLNLANTWGIGQIGKDNGILIAISRQFRQMRIQNGKGIEQILSNDDTKYIIDEYFIPNFKKGNYFEGTEIGLIALTNTLEEKQNKSTEAKQFTETLIELIEAKKIEELNTLTSSEIYCYLCFDKIPKREPIVKKHTFYKKYFKNLFNNELIKRLKRYENFVYRSSQENDYGDWGIAYTTYRKNEFGDGHEGAQFIFWIKEESGKLKLSGIEVVP